MEAVIHKGTARAGTTVHLRLKNLKTGHISESRLNGEQKVDDVDLEERDAQYLYAEGDGLVFMDNETFEQFSIPRTVIGPAAAFIRENDVIRVESFEGQALGIIPPAEVLVKVAETGAPIHGDPDAPYKPAVLENGVELMVPGMIATGDTIKVDVANVKYMERARK
jgi:elongation factor P